MKSLTPAKLTLVMFGFIGVLVAGYIVKSVFANVERPQPPRTRNLPMPISDLPVGTLITEGHLGMGPVLETDLTRDMLLANRVIVGRVTKEALVAAHPIRSNQLYEPGVNMPLQVPEAMRAVSIETRGSPAIVDGLIRPGQFVDLHFMPGGNDPRMNGGLTMTLLKGIKVLAINRRFGPGQVEDNRNVVTLELTPEQANIVMLANDRGSLNFSYNPEGKGDGTIALKGKDRATLEEILGLEPIKQPDPPPAPPAPFISQIYRGIGRGEIEFHPDGRIIESRGYRNAPTTNPQTPAATGTSPAPLNIPSQSPGGGRMPQTGQTPAQPAPRTATPGLLTTPAV